MSSSRLPAIRFAVGSPAGLHSVIWRLWVSKGKSDVYLAARTLAPHIKVSLHESGLWQHSFSRELAERQSMAVRHRSRWSPPPDLIPGVTLAYRVIVPWCSVTLRYEIHRRPPQVVWIPAPPDGWIVEFQIWLTASGALVSNWPGRRSRGTVLVGKVGLTSGGSVWVTALEEPAPAQVLEQVRQWREWWGSSEIAKRGELAGANMRALLFGEEGDGSRTYMDIDLSVPDLSS